VKFTVFYDWGLDLPDDVETPDADESGRHLARAGTSLHGLFYGKYAGAALAKGAQELRIKQEFLRNRENGFSCGRAIRAADGKVVRVVDQQKKRPMISMPDFVDYRTNRIAEFKSVYLRRPPHDDGVLLTKSGPVTVDGPRSRAHTAEMGNSWDEFRGIVQNRLSKKYEAQIIRYAQAYFKATGNVPEFILCIAAFAKTSEYYQ